MADTPRAEQGRLAKLTAAPLTVELGGQRFEVAPLTLRQWAQLKRFAQEIAVAEFCRLEAKMIASGASPAMLDRFRNRALLAIDHPLESWPADDHEVSVERVILSLQAARPQTTREEVERILDEEVARTRIAASIAELAAMEARIKNGPRARSRAKAAKPTPAPKPSGSPSSKPSQNSTTGRRSKSAT